MSWKGSTRVSSIWMVFNVSTTIRWWTMLWRKFIPPSFRSWWWSYELRSVCWSGFRNSWWQDSHKVVRQTRCFQFWTCANYPNLSAMDFFRLFSNYQIGRYSMSAIDFVSRTKTLVRKLHEQGFKLARLRFVIKQCFAVHLGLLTKHGEPLSDLCHLCCPIIYLTVRTICVWLHIC